MISGKISIIIIFFIIIIIAGYLFLQSKVKHFYGLAIDPKVSKASVFANDINSPTIEFPDDDKEKKIDWLEKSSEIKDGKSFDGIDIKAYVVKHSPQSGKWAIVVHGYTQNPVEMAPNAYTFYDEGFNVLVPNLRGHGLSGGDYIGMGWNDRKDIIFWINSIIYENPEAEIVLYGISMGAATVMMASGETLPPNVKCIIEDCGYTSAWDEFAYQLKSIYSLPPFPLMNMVNNIVIKKAGYDLREASALNQVKKCSVPMMFIHGTEDRFVPFYMQDILYNAATCEKMKMVVKDAGHGESYKVAPRVYWENVFEFISKYVGNAEPIQ